MPKEDVDAREVINRVFLAEGIVHLKERSAAVAEVEFEGGQGVQVRTVLFSHSRAAFLLSF
jgi:hypothetical protein